MTKRYFVKGNVGRTHTDKARQKREIEVDIASQVHIINDLLPYEGKYYDRSNPKYYITNKKKEV